MIERIKWAFIALAIATAVSVFALTASGVKQQDLLRYAPLLGIALGLFVGLAFFKRW